MYICDEEQLKKFREVGDLTQFVEQIPDNEINLLHLSDPHFYFSDGTPAQVGEQINNAWKELREHIDSWKRFSELDRLDGCLVSGDTIMARKLVEPFLVDGNVPDEMKDQVFEKYRTWHRSAAEVIRNSLEPEDWDHVEKRFLVVPGNHDVMLNGSFVNAGQHEITRAHSFCHNFASFFLAGTPCRNIDAGAYVGYPRVCLLGNNYGVLALIGIDSNQAVYRYDAKAFSNFGLFDEINQKPNLMETVKVLRQQVHDRPLYIVIVMHHHLLPVKNFRPKDGFEKKPESILFSVTLDSRLCMETFQNLRMSMVLHGHMHADIVNRNKYIPLKSGAHRDGITIVGCPSYGVGEDTHGAIILNFDLWRGTGRADIYRRNIEAPLSTMFPMISSSQISPGEMRIYSELTAWLVGKDELPSGARPECKPKEDGGKFVELVNENWNRTGYTQLCGLSHGTKAAPFPLDEDDCPHWRKKEYNLLLLLRKAGSKLEILLNNHKPLRPSEFGDWDSLLLPAFKPQKIHEFLNRVKSDLLRVQERYLHVNKVKTILEKRKVEKLIKERVTPLFSLDLQKLSKVETEIDTKTFIRFSPTDGAPQVYIYKLVALHWFALKKGDIDNYSLEEILEHLPATTKELINAGAIRWNPKREEEFAGELEKLGPGLVWFPLDRWEECEVLIKLPRELLLGQLDVIELIMYIKKKNKNIPKR